MDMNDQFQSYLTKYFSQEASLKLQDSRPESHYQFGFTPSKIEKARNNRQVIDNLSSENKPVSYQSVHDLKERFFHHTPHSEFRKHQVVPQGFKDWEEEMDRFSGALLDTVETVSRMLCLGLGLQEDVFVDMMKNAPHLMAPTGADLGPLQEHAILAGFHSDLNFLTIHGASRFPGLTLWTREGRKLAAKVPPGCLLLQAGQMLEALTGGRIQAGYHEVTVNKETLRRREEVEREGGSLWRVSSTCFAHLRSDVVLEDLLDTLSGQEKILVGDHVMRELEAISLCVTKD